MLKAVRNRYIFKDILNCLAMNDKKALKKKDFLEFFYLSYFKVSSRRKFFFYLVLFLVGILYIARYIYFQKFNQIPTVVLVLDLLFMIFIISTIFNFIKIVVISTYRRIKKIPVSTTDNIILGIDSLYWISLGIALFIGVLQFVHIDMKTFFTSFALISVAFSWIFKEYISNILDGLIIMFSKDFNIGDYIIVGEYKGRIRHITFMNTEIKTDEGDIVFIPNTLILQREVTNFSKIKSKRIIYSFEIDKLLFPKTRKIETTIIKNLKKDFNDIFEESKFFLKVVKIHHEGALLSAKIPIKKYNFALEDEIKKNVSLSVMEFIDKEDELK